MTRKDYIAIAGVLVRAQHDCGLDHELARVIADDLGEVFAEDNPAFDVKRWLAACGLD